MRIYGLVKSSAFDHGVVKFNVKKDSSLVPCVSHHSVPVFHPRGCSSVAQMVEYPSSQTAWSILDNLFRMF